MMQQKLAFQENSFFIAKTQNRLVCPCLKYCKNMQRKTIISEIKFHKNLLSSKQCVEESQKCGC
uniref:Uncharacterized protein n=1 Tax=Arion vulgaris TaxID=1028688 RepID=A0A0B6ZG57_9EUPU